MNSAKRLFYDFNFFLKTRYGEKIRRIMVNTGLGCPNRENGKKGCVYCLNGSASIVSNASQDIRKQIEQQINRFEKNKKAKKFIAYFQAYTNTYAPPEKLKNIFSNVSFFPEIVAVAIGTRPDCIDREKLSAIRNAVCNKDIWIEYGLQSVNPKTLAFINRGHGIKTFQQAIALTKDYGIETGAHVILGFPWETKKDIILLARFLAKCRIDFIKIHLLHVLKGTPLEYIYNKGKIKLPDLSSYAKMAACLIEHLPRTVVIQRLTGEGTAQTHVAPEWALNKTKVISEINNELLSARSFQGKFC